MQKRTAAKNPLFLSILMIVALSLTACDAVSSEPIMDVTPGAEVSPGAEAETGVTTEAEIETEPEADTETAVETTAETEAEAEIAPEAASGDSAATGTGGVAGVAQGTMIRSYALIDWDFVNQDGAVSGEIEDFYFDMDTGRIPFVSIEYGGFLDIGDTEIAVPLSAFSWGAADELVLNIEEEALQNFPDLGDDWPDVTNPAWDDEVNRFWTDLGIDAGPNIDEASGPIVQASDLRDFSLVELGDSGRGTIQDMLVELAEGRVHYLLVGFGTASAAAEDAYILPLEIIDLTGTADGLGNELLFDANISEDTLLTAPRFDRQLFGDATLFEPGWNSAIDEYWQEQFSN